MRNWIKVVLIGVLVTLIINACKKDNKLEKPLVFLTPNTISVNSPVGQYVGIGITVDTDIELNRFEITSKIDIPGTPTIVEMDTVLNNLTSLTLYYEFLVLVAAADNSVVLSFKAFDVNGNTGSRALRIYVGPVPTQPELLSETTGHKMYSNNSQNADAYNLEAGVAMISSLSNPADLDLQDTPLNDSTEILSRSWLSPAGGQFVRFNAFDYANATDSSLVNAYKSGIELSQVDDIADGDIILTRLENSPSVNYAAIQVVLINDTDSTDQDFYLFNFKK